MPCSAKKCWDVDAALIADSERRTHRVHLRRVGRFWLLLPATVYAARRGAAQRIDKGGGGLWGWRGAKATEGRATVK